MKRLLILLTLVIAKAGPLLHAQSTREMKDVSQRSFEKADAELNATYKMAITTRSGKGATALREAQCAWITYRDKTSEAYGTGEEGGSQEDLMAINCSTALTKNRTAELKKLFLSDEYPY